MYLIKYKARKTEFKFLINVKGILSTGPISAWELRTGNAPTVSGRLKSGLFRGGSRLQGSRKRGVKVVGGDIWARRGRGVESWSIVRIRSCNVGVGPLSYDMIFLGNCGIFWCVFWTDLDKELSETGVKGID